MGISALPLARMRDSRHQYIRRVKGGKYQVRPWDDGERFNLGLYPTLELAIAAREAFWKHGGAAWYRVARLKYVRPLTTDPTRCRAVVTLSLGEFDTPEAAHAAAEQYLKRTEGLFAEVALKRG